MAPSQPRSRRAPGSGGKRSTAHLHLGYSTNVHRGESLREVYRFLREYTLPVKRRVFGRRPAGLELRLGMASARDLAARHRRAELRSFLESAGLEIFSVNAFPLVDFQARRVKERVYSPSWVERDRARWTIRICEIFADLLPDGRPGSVSTLGGTYRFWRHSRSALDRIALHYLDVLEALEDLEERTGKRIVLAAEPEPDTTFETALDVIQFVEERLIPLARERWKRRWRRRADVETAVRRRFTVNVDTCHFSVLFHDPARAIRDLLAAGLRIGKLHVTNALALARPHRSPRGYEVFRRMHEPRFLHQFSGVNSEGETVWRGRDLDQLPRRLRAGRDPDVAELRTHFHVPLYLKRWKILRTTREETFEALRYTIQRRSCSHLVLETYTWPVLAREDRLISGIAREFRWLLDSLERIA